MKIIGAFPETETPEIWMKILSIYIYCMYIYCSKKDDYHRLRLLYHNAFFTTLHVPHWFWSKAGFLCSEGRMGVSVAVFTSKLLILHIWPSLINHIMHYKQTFMRYDMIMGWQHLKSTIKRYCDLDMLILLGLGSSGVALQSSKTPSGLYRHHRTSTEMVFQSWNLRRKKQHIKFRLVNYFRNGSGDGWTETESWGSWWKQSSFVLILSILPPMVQVGFLSFVITSSCFFSSVYPAQWRKILQFDLHIFLTMGE